MYNSIIMSETKNYAETYWNGTHYDETYCCIACRDASRRPLTLCKHYKFEHNRAERDLELLKIITGYNNDFNNLSGALQFYYYGMACSNWTEEESITKKMNT